MNVDFMLQSELLGSRDRATSCGRLIVVPVSKKVKRTINVSDYDKPLHSIVLSAILALGNVRNVCDNYLFFY